MNLEFHTRVISKISSFDSLLEEWLTVQKQYCNSVYPDTPWDYTELPSVGLFAASAARIGKVILQEWRTEKTNADGKPCYGRNDLWLRMNPNSRSGDYGDYVFEAKYKQIQIDYVGNDKEIELALKSARKEASSIAPIHGCRMGMVFISLNNADDDNVSDKAKDVFNLMESKLEFDFSAAICFPTNSFRQTKKDGLVNDLFGMIVAARKV